MLAAKGQGDEDLEFWHTNFRRGHPELLHLVQRKVYVYVLVFSVEMSEAWGWVWLCEDLCPPDGPLKSIRLVPVSHFREYGK